MRIILSIFIIALVGCKSLSGKGVPAWVENPKSIYPENKYLAAVGEGDTRRAAENSAAAQLARIFEAHIDSEERLLEKINETNRSFERSTDYAAKVNILSSQTLFNLQHAEAWQNDKGRVFAVAYLNRRETAALYRDKIEAQTTQVNFLVANAAQTDDLLKKYATLRSAVRHATEARELVQQLKVIHPPSVPGVTPSYSERKIRQNLAETARNIRVYIAVEGDEQGRMGAILEEQITRYGFVVGTPATLNITGHVSITDTGQRAADLVFVRYILALQVTDSEGLVLASLNNKGREGHISLSEARIRSFRTLENTIETTGNARFDAYFDALIDPMPN